MLKICKKLQEKRFVFVKILAIIIPENGAKVSKIKCLRLNQQTLNMCSRFSIHIIYDHCIYFNYFVTNLYIAFFIFLYSHLR